jgi:uncharacterized Zn finger protein
MSPRRAEFGANWWAQRWINALVAQGWQDRLQRGRSYARTGQVRSIDIRPGLVDARVKGSRPRPYVVKIALAPFSEAVWEQIFDALASQARFIAQLLAGEMPPDIEDVFASVGAHLFPGPSEPLRTECSCPDWVNPCKHVAAVHYVLGSEFDRDPFLLLRLRGRTREQVLAALRACRSQAAVSAPAPSASAPPVPQPGADPPLSAQLETFWSFGSELGDLRFAIEPPRVPEAVLKRLGSPLPPRDGERSALSDLSRFYATISEAALRSAYEDDV